VSIRKQLIIRRFRRFRALHGCVYWLTRKRECVETLTQRLTVNSNKVAMTDYRERIRDYIRKEAKPVDKFGHQPRLYTLTRKIGKDLSYDDDVVFAAAWLHDLGVFVGHRPEDLQALAAWDNTAYAMAKAPEVLAKAGYPAEKERAVVEAIRTHQPHCAPSTLEGEILRDADILEQLGAIGIMRGVCKIGRDTRFPDFTSAAGVLRKAMATLPAQLRLAPARKLAEERISLLESFLTSLDSEAEGELY